MIVSVSLPLLLYLVIRAESDIARGFSPHFHYLLKTDIYPILIRSWFTQMGILPILFVVGCAQLYRSRNFTTLAFVLLSFFFIPFFHMLDNYQYSGYSRFNLFLIPIFTTGILPFMKRISRKKVLTGAILLCVILTNSIIWPINRDGTRPSGWGNGLIDTSEHFYPYPRTLKWIKTNYPSGKILFADLRYKYFFKFYFNKLQWHPEYQVLEMNQDRKGNTHLNDILSSDDYLVFDIVVKHIENRRVPSDTVGCCFKLKKTIKNQANLLAVYTRQE